jgi:hypothetical protein
MKYLSLILLLLVPTLSNSADWKDDLEYTVCQVGVEGVDDVYLLPCETHASQQGCVDGWLHWKLDNPAGNGKLSNATAALVSGKKIIVRTYDCSNNADHVYMLRIKK